MNQEIIADSADLDNAIIKKELPEKKDKEDETIKYGSQEWSDFIFKQFKEDELFNGCPRLEGLRRVTEEYFGNVLENTIQVNQVPSLSGKMMGTTKMQLLNPATVTCTIVVRKYDGLDTLTFSDAADTYSDNTILDFIRNPTAVASSKAEARTFRKILMLKKIIAAEELPAEDDDPQKQELVNLSQKTIINSLCIRNNINQTKFLEVNNVKDLAKEKFDKGVELVQLLNSYQQKPEEIPQEIKK